MPFSMSDTAFIFDFDGVVVLSEPIHALAWADMAAHFDQALPQGFIERGIGSTDALLSEYLAGHWGEPHTLETVLECKRGFYRRRASCEVSTVPGVREALETLGDRYPLALATSSGIGDVRACFECHDFAGHFREILTLESVRAHKPDPEIYLLAAERLGVAPRNCWVFEDSVPGATAARAAGMQVIGITTTFPAEALQPVAAHFPDFRELDTILKIVRTATQNAA